MEYSYEIEVDVPYSVMIELLEDPQNRSRWQPELSGHLLMSGEPGQVGAQTKLTYNMNGRPLEIIELITTRDLPNEKSARYETRGLIMHVTHRFAEIGPGTTFWRQETEIDFTNFLTKLIGYFMPQLFRDQTWKSMNLFKRFAEQTYRAAPS
jgi:hypothetical protein